MKGETGKKGYTGNVRFNCKNRLKYKKIKAKALRLQC